MQEKNSLFKKNVKPELTQKNIMMNLKCFLVSQFHCNAIWFWKRWEIKNENWNRNERK